MYVKYEGGEIVSLFIGCVPDDPEEYEEVPDDEAIVAAYIAKRKASTQPTPAPEDRIAALEEQLLAAKILLGVE